MLQVVLLGKETLRYRGSILGGALGTHPCWGVREAGLGRGRSWAVLYHNKAWSQALWSWKGSTELSWIGVKAPGFYTPAQTHRLGTQAALRGWGCYWQGSFFQVRLLLSDWRMSASVQKRVSGWHIWHPLEFILFSQWCCPDSHSVFSDKVGWFFILFLPYLK